MICWLMFYYLLIDIGGDKIEKCARRRYQLSSSWSMCSLCDWIHYPTDSPSSHSKIIWEPLWHAPYEVANGSKIVRDTPLFLSLHFLIKGTLGSEIPGYMLWMLWNCYEIVCKNGCISTYLMKRTILGKGIFIFIRFQRKREIKEILPHSIILKLVARCTDSWTLKKIN